MRYNKPMKLKNKRIFVCSDHHFGQESFYIPSKKYGYTLRPEFKNADEADAEIISRHNTVVPEFDSVLFYLGDLAKNITHLKKIGEMNGQYKILIAGNHDAKFTPAALNLYFHQVLGCTYICDRKYLLSHVPVHPNELRSMKNIHGHTHLESIKDNRYISACLEVNNYTPIEVK